MRMWIASGFLVVATALGAYACKDRMYNSDQKVMSTDTATTTIYDSALGATLTLNAGEGRVIRDGKILAEGPLDREGTTEATKKIRVTEAQACGTFEISYWVADGVIGNGDTVKLKWLSPEGPVRRECGFMMGGEGTYKKRIAADKSETEQTGWKK